MTRYVLRWGNDDIPITHFYTEDGETEVSKPADAWSLIAGPLPDGRLLVSEVEGWDIRPMQ